jgi:hypothetical protein
MRAAQSKATPEVWMTFTVSLLCGAAGKGPHDYTYFPQTDPPPLDIIREWVRQIRAAMREL